MLNMELPSKLLQKTTTILCRNPRVVTDRIMAMMAHTRAIAAENKMIP